MTLSREEIAVRLACADVQGSSLPPDKDRAVWAAQVVATTDAIGAALTHTPAPVPPPAGPCPGEDALDDAEARKRIAAYVPKAGDVVTLTIDKAARVVRVALNADEYAIVYGDHNTGTFRFDTFGRGKYVYLRDSTNAEKRAAGLAVPPPATTPVPEVLTPDVPEGSTIAQLAAEQRASMGLTASMGSTQHFTHAATPAPEAKRPTMGDVERSAEAFANHNGDIPHSPSDAWMDGWLARDRDVAHDGIAHSTNAPCPPPVASNPKRDEAVRALVAYAECEDVAWGQNDEWEAVMVRHGMEKGAHPHGFLGTLRRRALSLAREAGMCEGGSK